MTHENAGPGDQQAARAALEQGDQLYGRGLYAEAAAAYTRAAAADPSDPLVLADLARALARAGDPARALDASARGVLLAPSWALGWVRLAEQLALQQRAQDSHAALRIALRYEPRRAELVDWMRHESGAHLDPQFRSALTQALGEAQLIPPLAASRALAPAQSARPP